MSRQNFANLSTGTDSEIRTWKSFQKLKIKGGLFLGSFFSLAEFSKNGLQNMKVSIFSLDE